MPSFQIPLAAYELNGANLYTMEEAQFQLANECMNRFGFPSVTPPLNRDEMVAEQQESDARLYGIDSLSEAKARGYMPQVIPGSSQANAMPTQSASYEFVFTGSREGSVVPPPGGWKSPGKFGGLVIPPGGCLGASRTKLWGSPDSQVKDALAQSLRIDAYQQSEADPRVQALFGQWSTCMAQHGYQYQSPLQVEFNRPSRSTPSTMEINTAVADVTCKNKINLVHQWNQIDVDYQRQAIEKNQLALTDEENKIRAALEKATAELNGNH
ncbi:MAG: hypothetical protein ACRDP1_10580 [Nocardioidaceae bacterium]